MSQTLGTVVARTEAYGQFFLQRDGTAFKDTLTFSPRSEHIGKWLFLFVSPQFL